MTKSIDNLIKDMEHVVATGEGWTKEISEWVASEINRLLNRQFDRRDRPRDTLRPSSLGTPCERQLWYSTRSGIKTIPLPTSTRNKFIFGDFTEAYILGLVKASGHSLEGLQTELDICGIKGHRDCIIDGMLIDVKSASSESFKKFKQGTLRNNDTFGYISQLSSYLYGSQNDPLLIYKTEAAFLVFDKQHGHICLDRHDLSEEVKDKESEIIRKKEVVKSPDRPVRRFDPIEHGKSGNMKLGTNCSYCDFKNACWDGKLRKFIYSSGPVWFTKVTREPEVFEEKGF